MGRIKTQLVKRITNELMLKHGDSLKTDFNENKKIVEEHLSQSSRKIRNTIAGYATRLKKSGSTSINLRVQKEKTD